MPLHSPLLVRVSFAETKFKNPIDSFAGLHDVIPSGGYGTEQTGDRQSTSH